MVDRLMRLSHIVVRIAATLALADLGIGMISDRYYPAFSHALANSRLGQILLFFTMGTSLLLPFYVGFESLWMRKREAESRALWIDAALAVACFVLFMGVALYAFGHYAML